MIMSDELFISNQSVENFVERVLEDERGIEANYTEVQARVRHGDNTIFAVDVHTEEAKLEITIAIDMKVREQ